MKSANSIRKTLTDCQQMLKQKVFQLLEFASWTLIDNDDIVVILRREDDAHEPVETVARGKLLVF